VPCFHPDWIQKSIFDGELANTWSFVVGEDFVHERDLKEFEMACKRQKIPGTQKKAKSWIELYDALAEKETKKTQKEKIIEPDKQLLKKRKIRTRNSATSSNASPLISLSTRKIQKKRKRPLTKHMYSEAKEVNIHEESRVDLLCNQVDDSEKREQLINASKCLDNVTLNDKKCLSRLMRLLVESNQKRSSRRKSQLDDKELQFVEKCCRLKKNNRIRDAALEVHRHLKLRALEGIYEQMRKDPETSLMTLQGDGAKGLVRQVQRLTKNTKDEELKEASSNLHTLLREISTKKSNAETPDVIKKKKKKKKKKIHLRCEICNVAEDSNKKLKSGSVRCVQCLDISLENLRRSTYQLTGNVKLAIEFLRCKGNDLIGKRYMDIENLCFTKTDDTCVEKLSQIEKSGEKLSTSTKARQLLSLMGDLKSGMWKTRLEFLKTAVPPY